MKKLKTTLAMLMAGVLVILSGCGSPQNSNNSESTTGESGLPSENTGTSINGRYVEKDIVPEGEVALDLLRNKNGDLIFYTKGMESRYTSTDIGETWEKSAGPGQALPDAESVRKLALLDDGGVLALVSSTDGSKSDRLYRISPDNTVEEITLSEYDQMDGVAFITTMSILPGNKLLLGAQDFSGGMSPVEGEEGAEGAAEGAEGEEGNRFIANSAGNMNSGIQAVFSLETGEKLYDLINIESTGEIISDDTHFYMSDYMGSISSHNISDGKEVNRTEGKEMEDLQGMSSFSMEMLDIAPDGSFYSQNSNGIYKMNIETGEKTTVMKAEAYAIGSNNTMVSRFYAMGEDVFVAACMNMTGNGISILKYKFDSNATTNPDQVLKIWTLKESSALRSAISAFSQAYPESSVEVEVALQDGSGQEESDAIQNLNTRLLAGEGPDIILLDGTPMESYANKGMLVDMKDKINTEDMYSRISEDFSADGKVCYIPTRFKAPVLMTSESMMDKLSTLDTLVDEIEKGNGKKQISVDSQDPFAALDEAERPILSVDNFEELFDLLWDTSVNGVVQDGKINRETLGEWMEKIKRISDKYELAKAEDENEGGASGVAMMVGAGDGEVFSGSLISYISDRSIASGHLAGGIMGFKIAQKENTEYTPFPGLATGSYVPQAIMGISVNSKNEDFAVKFIQEMLSEKSQASLGGGLPVTSKGYDAQVAAMDEMERNEMGAVEEMTFNMKSFVEMLKEPVLTNNVIKQVILDCVKGFCSGDTDLQTALNAVESGTKTYLAELA